MKKFVLIVVGITVLLCCKKGAISEPKNLIDQDKMVDVLYDISILEAIKVSNPASLQSRGIDSKTYIYKKFEIDSLQFAQSDKFYASDVAQYAKLYKKVIDRINAEKTKDSLLNLPKKLPTSATK